MTRRISWPYSVPSALARALVQLSRSTDSEEIRSRHTPYSWLREVHIALIAAGLLAGLATAPTASADPSDAPATANNGASDLQEVVVTAEKRSGTVQSTPISITAYSGEQLQAQGITSVADMAYETPGVSVRNSGPGQTEYEMRGVASGGGSSPTVGFYLDDTPLTAPQEALLGKVVIDPSLYDLNRIEVLRGPQGTLYGSGSMGGTIKLVTNQPDPRAFDASAQLVGSDTPAGGLNYGVNAMLNLPLVQDTLALRVVASDVYTSGWIDRIVLNLFPTETNGGATRGNVLSAPIQSVDKDTNWARVDGVRASLLWQPTSQLTITPSVFVQSVTQGAPNYVDSPPGVSYEAHYQPFSVTEPYSDSFVLWSLPIKYDFGIAELSSSSGYYRRNTSLSQDASEIGQDFMEDIILKAPVSFAEAGPLSALEADWTSQFSEEVRLTSKGDSPLQWLVGYFYEDYKSTTTIGTTTPGPIVDDIFGVPSYFALTFLNDLKQNAEFGEASYKLGPLKLTGGLRFYQFSDHENLTESGGLITGPNPPLVFALPSSASGLNPKVNLSYQPSGDLTVYAQASKGFRPGGGNTPVPQSCAPYPLQYQPDSLWSYELGEKARLFQDTVTVNGAVYYENWGGIQQIVTETCGNTYNANAGTAHIYGGELELKFRLSQELTLSNAAGYTHADIASVVPGASFVVGQRIQDVPEWTNTTTLAFHHAITDQYTVNLNASNEYVGNMVDPSYNPVTPVPSHDFVNLRAGVSMNHLSATFFVNNLTDKRAYLGDPAEISFFVPAIDRVTTNQPRTFGLELNYYWR
jgi:iron complex outermembrane recepter protein